MRKAYYSIQFILIISAFDRQCDPCVFVGVAVNEEIRNSFTVSVQPTMNVRAGDLESSMDVADEGTSARNSHSHADNAPGGVCAGRV